MKVICEHCKKKFEMTQKMLKERYLGAMYTEIYYKCPLCGQKYKVCIQSPKAREIKNKIDAKTNEINKYISSGIRKIAFPEDIEDLNKLRNDLKKEMDKVNRRVS